MDLQKPLLIYDGDCGFCKRWIARWKKVTKDRVDYATSQEVGDQFPQIPKGEYEKSVQLVQIDGTVSSGAEAVFRTLAVRSRFFKLVLWKYKYIPGFAAVNERIYRLVAKHRKSSTCAQ